MSNLYSFRPLCLRLMLGVWCSDQDNDDDNEQNNPKNENKKACLQQK